MAAHVLSLVSTEPLFPATFSGDHRPLPGDQVLHCASCWAQLCLEYVTACHIKLRRRYVLFISADVQDNIYVDIYKILKFYYRRRGM